MKTWIGRACVFGSRVAGRLQNRFQSTEAAVSVNRDQFIVRSPHGDCDLSDVSIPNYIFSNMRFPENIAMECGMTGQKLKYKELYGLSRKFGSALLRMGLKKGDVLGLIIPNTPIFPVVFLGAAAVGVVVSPANPMYTPDEITRQFNMCQAKAILSFAPVAQGLNAHKTKLPNVTKFISLGGEVEGWTKFEDLIQDDGSYFKEAQIDMNDTVLLPYSSGTTGLPKGVCLTHRNLIASMSQLQYPGTGILRESTADYQERFLGLLPFFHIYGLAVVLLSSLWYGGKIVTLPRFEPELFLKTVAMQNVDLANDPIILPYSSGTTGLPKGVVLTHNNIVHNLCQYHTPGTTLLQSAIGEHQEKYISILPYFHIYGLVVTLLSGLWYGAHITVLPKFEPELFMKTLSSVKPTVLQLVPPLISFLANTPNLDRQAFERLHTLMSGAAPLGPAIAHKFLERINSPTLFLQEGYGMTETSPIVHVAPLKGYKIGSCGKLLSRTEAKVVNVDNGESLPAETEGELCIRGPQVMKGYFNNPEATAGTIDSWGWLHTGDIAKYDSEGRFYIVDRLKELIKVKGLQVAPSELEDVLRKHPGILDVAVIGIPDDRSGEVPRAYVVTKKGIEVTEQNVAQFVAEHVAPYKQLHGGVFFVDAIPKSNTGKILRRELKKAALSL